MGTLYYTNYSDYVKFYNYIINVEVKGTSRHYRGLTADFYRPVKACCCFFDAVSSMLFLLYLVVEPPICRRWPLWMLDVVCRWFARQTKTQVF